MGKISQIEINNENYDIKDNDALPLAGGIMTGILYTEASTPLFIGKNGKVGMRASSDTKNNVGQINVSNAWYGNGNQWGSQISAYNGETDKYNELRVSHNGVEYNDESGVAHQVLHDGNYSEYALPLTGGTVNGDVQILNSTLDSNNIIRVYEIEDDYTEIGKGYAEFSSNINGANIRISAEETAENGGGPGITMQNSNSDSSVVMGLSSDGNEVEINGEPIALKSDIPTTAEQVGALPITGGTINGNLEVTGNLGAAAATHGWIEFTAGDGHTMITENRLLTDNEVAGIKLYDENDNDVVIRGIYTPADADGNYAASKAYVDGAISTDIIVDATSCESGDKIVSLAANNSNTEWRYVYASGIETLVLTSSEAFENTAEAYYYSVVFISGTTATIFHNQIKAYCSGDDCVDGIFTPAASKTYDLGIWWNGLEWQAAVRGSV